MEVRPLLNIQFDIPGIGCDLTSSASYALGNINTACVGFNKKCFLGKESSRNISSISFYQNFSGIRAVKPDISCASFNRELFCGYNIIQGYISRISA